MRRAVIPTEQRPEGRNSDHDGVEIRGPGEVYRRRPPVEPVRTYQRRRRQQNEGCVINRRSPEGAFWRWPADLQLPNFETRNYDSFDQFGELDDGDYDGQNYLQPQTYHRRPRPQTYQRMRREQMGENDYYEVAPRDYNRNQNNYKLKMDIPTFNDSAHIEEFLEWIIEVERFFDYMDIDEDQQVKLVVLRFKGIASAWWDQTVTNRRRANQRPVRTWEKLKKLLKQRFLPSDYEGILFTQYHQCCQGNRTVSEYATKFHRLSSRNNLNETEEQLIARFVQGLKGKFQEKLIMQPQYTLMDTIRVADQLGVRQTLKPPLSVREASYQHPRTEKFLLKISKMFDCTEPMSNQETLLLSVTDVVSGATNLTIALGEVEQI